MTKLYLYLASIALIIAIFSLACNLTSNSMVSIPPETIAALTWSAMESEAARLPTYTPSPVPPSSTPTFTFLPPTITRTSTPTDTPITPITPRPTDTPGPTSTNTSIVITTYKSGGSGGSSGGGSGGGSGGLPPCNAAEFIKDVTIPNGTLLPPSTAFTKIWRIKNIGSCTWNQDYKFVFDYGDRMGAENIFLPKKVRPGETIDIEIDMLTPASDGTYTNYWYLRDKNKILFGYGNDLDDPFKAKVIVAANPQGTIFDFTEKYCKAEWKGENKTLPCPGRKDSKSGFVIKYKKPELEGGSVSDSALWTHPPMEKGDTITGKYPAILIQSGYQFRSEIGCLSGNPKCNVNFALYYKEANQEKQLLGQWNQVLDGTPKNLNIDLSSLSGKYIIFIFSVIIRFFNG